MSGIKDPYAVLGVDRYAQDSEIRESYERLKAAHEGDATVLEQIEQAYGILSDLQKRAEYDIKGKVSSVRSHTRKKQVDGIIRARNTLNTLFLVGAAVTLVFFILQWCGYSRTPFYWACGISMILKVAEYILRLIP